MHKIFGKRSIECIPWIKFKTDNYELWCVSSIKTNRMRILGGDSYEL